MNKEELSLVIDKLSDAQISSLGEMLKQELEVLRECNVMPVNKVLKSYTAVIAGGFFNQNKNYKTYDLRNEIEMLNMSGLFCNYSAKFVVKYMRIYPVSCFACLILVELSGVKAVSQVEAWNICKDKVVPALRGSFPSVMFAVQNVKLAK